MSYGTASAVRTAMECCVPARSIFFIFLTESYHLSCVCKYDTIRDFVLCAVVIPRTMDDSQSTPLGLFIECDRAHRRRSHLHSRRIFVYFSFSASAEAGTATGAVRVKHAQDDHIIILLSLIRL